jgi:competence protein ComEA
VQDAIDMAGGLLSKADTRSLNLAEILEDGQRILVPTRLPPTHTPDPNITQAPIVPPEILYPININTATQAELESLPQIGPVTAQKIINYRQVNGPFESIEDIQDVPGIGPKTFEVIKDLITV